jgi:hypothetical protein
MAAASSSGAGGAVSGERARVDRLEEGCSRFAAVAMGGQEGQRGFGLASGEARRR